MRLLRSKMAWSVVSLLFAMILVGCASPTTSSRGIYEVDPAFSDFYREMGAEEVLGSAISPLIDKDGTTYQYVVSGLMAYDPNRAALKRFYFSPIAASTWKVNGQVEQPPTDSSTIYVNGHKIWDEVLPFYEQYGANILGVPLTKVEANDLKQRYEQYFDGVGFYRNYSDSPGTVHLMPYGDWLCGTTCPYASSDSTPPGPSYVREYSATEQVFLDAAERFSYDYTGEPLSPPSMSSDGNYEMAFENVVLFIDPSSGSQVKLRPVPAWLGIQSDAPVEEEQAEWLSFFPVQEGLGYNVPTSFFDYINAHGGMDYSGNPITEYRELPDGGYSQCFTNLCLEYHPNAPIELRIGPHSLGADYLTSGTQPATPGPAITEALQINTWEDYPLIPSGGQQVIHVEATRNNTPVNGIQVSLLVKQPDGLTKTYVLDPTGQDGRARGTLDPIDGPNGAIVPYEVCVVGNTSPQICFSRSYTIWQQP
ncbi:MAG: hypothetical protein C3F13_06700 [Anaerolineales bacterium]|nr:hypothetical protein [Anaerolineae bacterium]PWB54438.1 MAG: hypothetical protein C3F13_06700 [Anaerolineales bacterium]